MFENKENEAKFGDVQKIVVLLNEAKTDTALIDKALDEFSKSKLSKLSLNELMHMPYPYELMRPVLDTVEGLLRTKKPDNIKEAAKVVSRFRLTDMPPEAMVPLIFTDRYKGMAESELKESVHLLMKSLNLAWE